MKVKNSLKSLRGRHRDNRLIRRKVDFMLLTKLIDDSKLDKASLIYFNFSN